MDAHRNEPATKKDLDLVREDLDQVKQVLTDKIDVNSAKIDKLTVYAIENREQLSKMLTREEYKKDYKKDYNALLRGQDEMMVILTRIDQERAATNSRIDRVEGDVETNKSEIKRIKTKLAMDT